YFTVVLAISGAADGCQCVISNAGVCSLSADGRTGQPDAPMALAIQFVLAWQPLSGGAAGTATPVKRRAHFVAECFFAAVFHPDRPAATVAACTAIADQTWPGAACGGATGATVAALVTAGELAGRPAIAGGVFSAGV